MKPGDVRVDLDEDAIHLLLEEVTLRFENPGFRTLCLHARPSSHEDRPGAVSTLSAKWLLRYTVPIDESFR